jgi:hypothetical protein
MEEGAATEQASQGKEQRCEERFHREDATVRENKKSTESVSTTFLVGTGGFDWGSLIWCGFVLMVLWLMILWLTSKR